jgi:hypothetical protein
MKLLLPFASLTLLSWLSILAGVSVAKPLIGGVFLGSGNHTMIIASAGDRICYQSVNRGVMVSSVTPDPEHKGMYRLDGIPGFALYQPSANTLLYGELNQLSKAKAISQSPKMDASLMQKCLSSSGTFFKKSSDNRGG